ncbi:MAG: DUF7577 domain-containing protein [Candidatus Thorarchaeota archaeon]|jgi:hypothetical protein
MVYCEHCGGQNDDSMNYCGNCGAELKKAPPPAAVAPPSTPDRQRRLQRKPEEECFGVPGGGVCCWSLVGIIMIVSAVGWVMGWDVTTFWSTYLGALIVGAIGVMIIIGAVYDYQRRR